MALKARKYYQKPMKTILLLIGVATAPLCFAQIGATIPATIPASLLCREYEKNEMKADAEYAGKPLSIYGAIDKVAKDIGGEPSLFLKTSDNLVDVICHFTDASQILNCRPGEKIVIDGTVKGKNAMGIVLEGCRWRH
jgi:hypothetical protein